MNDTEIEYCPLCNSDESISQLGDRLPDNVWYCGECESFFLVKEIELGFIIDKTTEELQKIDDLFKEWNKKEAQKVEKPYIENEKTESKIRGFF